MQEASETSAGLPSRSWGPEHLFATLVGVFGLCFVFGLPPGQGADEPSHYPRAYHISEGHLFPQMFPGCEWGGGDLPRSVQWLIDACFHVGNNAQAQVKMGSSAAVESVSASRSPPIIYPTAALLVCALHPASTAIPATRSACGAPQFYAGRLTTSPSPWRLFWAIRIAWC